MVSKTNPSHFKLKIRRLKTSGEGKVQRMFSFVLWIEISFVNNKNIICGIIHRHHNSPDQIICYFKETIEKLITAL